jgi:hypothetical protein
MVLLGLKPIAREVHAMQSRPLFVASAFSALVGISGLAGSAIVYRLMVDGSIYSIPFIGSLFKTFEGLTLYLGIFVVAASLVHLVVGLLLWKCKKMGGYLGFALSAVEVLSYLSVLFFPTLALPMVAFLGLGSAFLILITTAWDSLA